MAGNIIQTTQLIEKANEILAKHAIALDKAATSFSKYAQSTKLPSDFVNSSKTQEQNLKAIEKAQQKTIRTQKQLERERVKELRLATKREKAFDKYERQLEREQRRLNRTTGLYNQVQQRVNKLTLEYNNLAAKKALNGKLTQQELSSLAFLEKQLNKYQGVLKKVDANVGKYQRNVGNYASAYDGLGFSVAQITREMPAFANSVQTGFMAISNNLPIFFDEISKTRKEVARLRAQGIQTESAMQKLGKAFFSLQSLLSLGIVLLTVYGKEIVDWASSMLNASNAADRMAENTKKINEESAELSSQTIPQFQALVKIAQDVTKSEQERADAMRELQSQYPDFNASILKESDNTELVNDAISEYINKLGQKAKAQASMNMMQEKYNELILKEQEIQEFAEEKILRIAKAQNDQIQTVQQAIAWFEKLSYEIESGNRKRTASNRAENNYQATLDSLIRKQKEGADIQEEINQLMDIYIDNVDLSTKATKNRTKAETELNDELENTATNSEVAFERQISALRELQKNTELGSAQWNIYNNLIKLLTDSLKALKGELKTTKAELLDTSKQAKLAAQAVAGAIAGAAEPEEETEDRWRETFQSITDVARRAFGIINQLSEASFQRQFDDLEKQKEAALLFAGESATARANIEEQYDRKKRQIEKRQAQQKKASAIFDITVDTASAVVRALPNIALASIVGALGLAQLALVASQQIPAFWQGGVVGGEQQIMVNDDPYGKKGSNYKEVIEKPNGKILTPQGKNVKMTVPKGTIVHPTYDAFINSLDSELLSNNIMPVGTSMMPMIINQGLSKVDILDVMNSHANKLVSTIERQHGINVNIDENGINKYVTKKGRTTKIMNARYSGTGINV